eukprot:1148645-Pelagomonas_calceolata.AAC.11
MGSTWAVYGRCKEAVALAGGSKPIALIPPVVFGIYNMNGVYLSSCEQWKATVLLPGLRVEIF